MEKKMTFPNFDATKSYIGTCQCCGRAQVVNKAHMVLHGYTRPGDGYIFGECPGQRAAPFELSCDMAKESLKYTRENAIPVTEKRIADLAADRLDTLTIRIPDGYHRGRAFRTAKIKLVHITRGYVHAKSSENDYSERGMTFDDFRKRALANAQAQLEGEKSYAARLVKTIASWKYAPEALQTRAQVAAKESAAKERAAAARALKANWKELWKGVSEAIRDHKDGRDWNAKDKAAFAALPPFPSDKARAVARKVVRS